MAPPSLYGDSRSRDCEAWPSAPAPAAYCSCHQSVMGAGKTYRPKGGGMGDEGWTTTKVGGAALVEYAGGGE